MVKDDIEALPPIPYEPIEQDSSMPDMGNDESEVITGNDWSKFDNDIITDVCIAQTRGGGGFDGSKITTYK